jgi:hypothetical protein
LTGRAGVGLAFGFAAGVSDGRADAESEPVRPATGPLGVAVAGSAETDGGGAADAGALEVIAGAAPPDDATAAADDAPPLPGGADPVAVWWLGEHPAIATPSRPAVATATARPRAVGVEIVERI